MTDLGIVAVVEARDDRLHFVGTEWVRLWGLMLEALDVEGRGAFDDLVIDRRRETPLRDRLRMG